MDPKATNYNPDANKDEGCTYGGDGDGGDGGDNQKCTDSSAENYNQTGECAYLVDASLAMVYCDPEGIKLGEKASQCVVKSKDTKKLKGDIDIEVDDSKCSLSFDGTTTEEKCLNKISPSNINKDPGHTVWAKPKDGTKFNSGDTLKVTDPNDQDKLGCTNPKATNYNASAEVDNGSCTYPEPSFNNVSNILCIEEKINLGEKATCKVITSVPVAGDYDIVVDGGQCKVSFPGSGATQASCDLIPTEIGKHPVTGGPDINNLTNYNDELEVTCPKDKIYSGDSCVSCENGKIPNSTQTQCAEKIDPENLLALDCDPELIYIKPNNEKTTCMLSAPKALSGSAIIKSQLSEDSCTVDFGNSLSASCDFFAAELDTGSHTMVVPNSDQIASSLMSPLDLTFLSSENNSLEDNVEVRDLKDEECADNQFWNGATCQACPAGSKPNSSGNGCIQEVNPDDNNSNNNDNNNGSGNGSDNNSSTIGVPSSNSPIPVNLVQTARTGGIGLGGVATLGLLVFVVIKARRKRKLNKTNVK